MFCQHSDTSLGNVIRCDLIYHRTSATRRRKDNPSAFRLRTHDASNSLAHIKCTIEVHLYSQVPFLSRDIENGTKSPKASICKQAVNSTIPILDGIYHLDNARVRCLIDLECVRSPAQFLTLLGCNETFLQLTVSDCYSSAPSSKHERCCLSETIGASCYKDNLTREVLIQGQCHSPFLLKARKLSCIVKLHSP